MVVVSDPTLSSLTTEERDALLAAAAWYARYHAADIAQDAEDPSMAAATDRARYVALLQGLAKLGINIPLPDEITGWGKTLAA